MNEFKKIYSAIKERYRYGWVEANDFFPSYLDSYLKLGFYVHIQRPK